MKWLPWQHQHTWQPQTREHTHRMDFEMNVFVTTEQNVCTGVLDSWYKQKCCYIFSLSFSMVSGLDSTQRYCTAIHNQVGDIGPRKYPSFTHNVLHLFRTSVHYSPLLGTFTRHDHHSHWVFKIYAQIGINSSITYMYIVFGTFWFLKSTWMKLNVLEAILTGSNCFLLCSWSTSWFLKSYTNHAEVDTGRRTFRHVTRPYYVTQYKLIRSLGQALLPHKMPAF